MENEPLIRFNQERFSRIVRIEEDSHQARLIFLPSPDREAEYQDLMTELWHEMTQGKMKIRHISFRLNDSSQNPFLFTLENLDITKIFAARNGTLSLYLSDREVRELIRLSGQKDNSRPDKVAIYAFCPQAPEAGDNLTIFFAKNLESCLVEKTREL